MYMQIADKKGEGLRDQLYSWGAELEATELLLSLYKFPLQSFSHALIHVQTIVNPYNAERSLSFASSQKVFVFFVEQCAVENFHENPFSPLPFNSQ